MCASALDRAALQAAGGLLYQSVQLLDLDVAFGPAVGLHAVHSGIALTDAVLVAEEGSRSKEDDHRIAAKALEKLCVARRLDDAGVKHLRALLSNKTRYSYGDDEVRDDEFKWAKMKMSASPSRSTTCRQRSRARTRPTSSTDRQTFCRTASRCACSLRRSVGGSMPVVGLISTGRPNPSVRGVFAEVREVRLFRPCAR